MIGGRIGGNPGGALRGVAENPRVADLREPAYYFGVMTKRLRQTIPGLAGHVGAGFVVHGREVHALGANRRPKTLHAGSPRFFGADPMSCATSLFAYPRSARFNPVASGMVEAAS